MQRPNAFTIGDRLIADPEGHWVTVKAFVKPSSGRQLVRVEFPDGTHRNRSFESLRRLIPTVERDASRAPEPPR